MHTGYVIIMRGYVAGPIEDLGEAMRLAYLYRGSVFPLWPLNALPKRGELDGQALRATVAAAD